MLKHSVRAFTFMLLLAGALILVSNTHHAWGLGTIYIRADGSIDPPIAPIQRNGDLYTLTDNISSDTDGIVIERDSMTFDGAGYSLITTTSGYPHITKTAVALSGRSDVEIRNLKTRYFCYGVSLSSSSNIRIYTNDFLMDWGLGYPSSSVKILNSVDSQVYENNITGRIGIYVTNSSNNFIANNNIGYGYEAGFVFEESANNTICENSISGACNVKITLYDSNNNSFYHNDIYGKPVGHNVVSVNSTNTWDAGYPSGGNYWERYVGNDTLSGSYQNVTGSDGIGDTPFVIDTENQDRYPWIRASSMNDLGITNVSVSRIGVKQGSSVDINVTILNCGVNVETSNVTVYAKASVIETKEVTLASRNTATLSFTWNTSGFTKDTYLIRAYVWPVQDETNLADNNYTDGTIAILKDTAIVFSLTPNPAYVGQTITLQGNLIDEYDTPLKNTVVDVYLNGTLVTHLQTNMTCWFQATGKPSSTGTYKINVTFSGSETHISSNYTQTLSVIQKENTKLSFNLSPNHVKAGQTITLTGNLTDTHNNPISNAPVKVYYSIDNGITWVYTGTIQTNMTGQFTAKGKLTIVGIFLIAALFNGNFMYNPSYHIEALTITVPT